MIRIDVFDRRLMQPGDRRELILSGDGPFAVTNSCFVDTPPPPGFRPCSACNSVVIAAGEPYFVVAEQRFWTGKRGTMELTIKDSVGESLTIRMAVRHDDDIEPERVVARASY